MSECIDLTGQKFGRLTVIKRADNRGKQIIWLCKCDCGKETFVSGGHLKNGHTKSCGCIRNEHITKHGLINSRLYNIWHGIKNRCYNKNSESYKNYGSRGIRLHEEWKSNFLSFYNWAINNGYKSTLTIDRINVDGDYEPNNCRWVDRSLQNRNKRNNHLLTYKNETRCLTEWAEIFNINRNALSYRVNILHLTLEEAFTKK